MATKPVKPKQWQEITREERYFCSFLFHDIRKDIREGYSPFLELLRESAKSLNKQLGVDDKSKIVDAGYEVCYFRDMDRLEENGKLEKKLRAKSSLQNLNLNFSKQTFDLMLWLSDESVVIIEAKAHQSFKTKQIGMLITARDVLKHGLGIRTYIASLRSSHYHPKQTTRNLFNADVTWSQLQEVYGHRETGQGSIYKRADDIYRSKPTQR